MTTETTRARRRPTVGSTDTIGYTLRFTQAEAFADDELVLHMRRRAGLKRLDKAEVIRALLRIARTDPQLQARVLGELS